MSSLSSPVRCYWHNGLLADCNTFQLPRLLGGDIHYLHSESL
jgi:hypothetical protein